MQDASSVSAHLFEAYDIQRGGTLGTDLVSRARTQVPLHAHTHPDSSTLCSPLQLTAITMDYFQTLETVHPEQWVRAMIERNDTDKDGEVRS